MLSKQQAEGRYQVSVVSLDELVPQDHLVRKIEHSIDFSFIYDLVEDRYCLDNGRPSVDPVVLIKMVFIQYLFGIRSMRQTIKEIETNLAYRWFLGYDFTQPIPHFTTFGISMTVKFFRMCLNVQLNKWESRMPWLLMLVTRHRTSANIC